MSGESKGGNVGAWLQFQRVELLHYQLTLSVSSALGDLWSVGPVSEQLQCHHTAFLLAALGRPNAEFDFGAAQMAISQAIYWFHQYSKLSQVS